MEICSKYGNDLYRKYATTKEDIEKICPRRGKSSLPGANKLKKNILMVFIICITKIQTHE